MNREFVFPLLAREFTKGKGKHTEGWICVVVYGSISGRCGYILFEFLDAALHARPFARADYPFIGQTKVLDLCSGLVLLPGRERKPKRNTAACF